MSRTEDSSEPGWLLHSMWGCELSDLAGRCSSTWCEGTLVVSSSQMGEPLGSSWHLRHHPYVQYAQRKTLTGWSLWDLVAWLSSRRHYTDQEHQSSMHPPWWLPSIHICTGRLVGCKCCMLQLQLNWDRYATSRVQIFVRVLTKIPTIHALSNCPFQYPNHACGKWIWC